MTRYLRFSRLCAAAFLLSAVLAPSVRAQGRRLELADSALNAPRPGAEARADDPAADPAREQRLDAQPSAPASRFPRSVQTPAGSAFVRDQAVLGALVYGPSFARAVARAGVPSIAAYLVMGGGSYLMAVGLSHGLAITETQSRFATWSALHGAVAGWALAQGFHSDEHGTAGAVFLGSVAGTAGALAFGGGLTDGEAAASNFFAEVLASATWGMASASGDARAGGLLAVGAGLAGAPLGYLYAHSARYRVTSGDVTTLWTSAVIGAAAASVAVVDGSPSRARVAATLAGGAVLGAIAGDRLLVRRFDHTRGEGRSIALAAAAGGAAGAGLAMWTAAAHDRRSVATVASSAAGALGGMALAEYLLAQGGGHAPRAGGVRLNALGLAAAATGRPGTYPLGRVTF